MNTQPKKSWRTGVGWGLYDFANSGYYLVYALLVFPLYLSSVALKDDTWFAAKWGVAQGAAVAMAVVAGLAWSRNLDKIGVPSVARLAMVLPGVASLLFPLLVALRASGNLLLICYVVVHGIYLLSLTIYDSSLPHVARTSELVEVSGWAWGVGYAGGLVCMALMEVGLKFWPRYSTWDFLVGSIFFLMFGLVAAVWVRRLVENRPVGTDAGPSDQRLTVPATDGKFGDPAHWRVRTSRWRLLAIFILVIDGIAVFMAFFAIIASKVAHVGEREITAMLAVLQLLAFPLTGLVCAAAKYRVDRLVLVCGIVWGLAAAIVLVAPSHITMWAAVVLMAAVVGSTQAAVRAIYAMTVQKDEAMQGFGVYAVVEKGAAFLGPTLAGLAIVALGHRAVMAFAGAMVFVGCALLARVAPFRVLPGGGAHLAGRPAQKDEGGRE